MKRLLPVLLTLVAVAAAAGPLEDASRAPASTRRAACAIARHAAIRTASGKPVCPLPVKSTGLLARQMPCFVTISLNGTRRHCMGSFQPQSSTLAAQIADAAAKAWKQDRRRKALTVSELGRAQYVVTIPGERKAVADPSAYPPANYGVVVVRSGRSAAVLLPGEAKTTRWQVAEAKRQAGIAPGAQVSFEVFRAVTWK